jgi:hypothetical protein
MYKSKGVQLKTPKKNSLFIGSHKTVQNEQEDLDSESDPEYEQNTIKLLKIELLQQELERRLARYEKNQDVLQYGLIAIIVLLLIKLIIDTSKSK